MSPNSMSVQCTTAGRVGRRRPWVYYGKRATVWFWTNP